VLTACGGGSSVPHSAASGPTTVTFKIDKPLGTSAANRRSPKYISPATTALTIDVKQNGSSIGGYPVTAQLTPTSNGCSSTLASTLCQVTLPLAPGSYTATLTTADANNTTLSAQTISFTIVAGQNNVVPLILSGIPYAIGVTTGGYAVTGSASSGLTLYGTATQPILVSAFDADGNIIIGPGAPAFSASVLSGNNWTVNAPATTAPNTVTITPPGTNGSGATIAVTAVYPDSTCTQTGAVCARTFSITNHIQTLFVATQDAGIDEAFPPGQPTILAALGSTPEAVALGPSGNLFIATSITGVAELLPPYTGAPVTIANGVQDPLALAFDAGGDLFVADSYDSTVREYAPPYTGSPLVTLPGSSVWGLAVDPSSGNLFVPSESSHNVLVYAPPYTGTPTTITAGIDAPFKVALDGAGDLFVLDVGNGWVTEYAPPYTGSPIATITSGVVSPAGLAIDGTGKLFVANEGGNNVTIYAPPYTGTPAVVGSGTFNPFAVALDGAGNLYVANINGSNVTEYAPPYTGSPIATIYTGQEPISLVLTP
jgi:hypothetical protein